jgi:hypothetical protein
MKINFTRRTISVEGGTKEQREIVQRIMSDPERPVNYHYAEASLTCTCPHCEWVAAKMKLVQKEMGDGRRSDLGTR